jgi:hypothetical protein
MRRTRGVMGSLGLALVSVGWLTPASAFACTPVAHGTSLEDALGLTPSAGELELDVTTTLCVEEGWSDPTGLECLSLLPGKDLTINVVEEDGKSGITPIELPGLLLPQITSTRSKVTLSDATLVGSCAGSTSGVTARLVVEGDHEVNLTDVSLEGGSLYGLFAANGTFIVKFTDLTAG